jgi:hypothetical protein
MSMVLAMDDGLAAEVSEYLPGVVYPYLGDRMHEVPLLRQALEGPERLHAYVEDVKPHVLVLDVCIGGNAYLATDAVELILRGPERLSEPPAVVLLAPRRAPALLRHAAELGCYNVLATSKRSLAKRIADEALLARNWRDERGARPLALVLRRPAISVRARGARRAS